MPAHELTPDSIYNDNHSADAIQGIGLWRESRDSGNLILCIFCGDARCKCPARNSIHFRTIASGAPLDQYKNTLFDPRVKGVWAITHIGCGGLKANGELATRVITLPKEGITAYVANQIYHPDPFAQALAIASRVARLTDKPVLAAVQRHQTLEIYPFALLEQRGRNITNAAPLEALLHNEYNPTEIYANGIPSLHRAELPPFFSDQLARHERDRAKIFAENPYFSQTQEVQDPGLVIMSTSLKPTEVIHPALGKPGAAFQLNSPRLSFEPALTGLSNREISTIWDQAEYPITHRNQNQGQDGLPFANTGTMLIEAGKMDVAQKIALRGIDRPWMRQWVENGGRIIVSEMYAGEVRNIAYFTP